MDRTEGGWQGVEGLIRRRGAVGPEKKPRKRFLGGMLGKKREVNRHSKGPWEFWHVGGLDKKHQPEEGEATAISRGVEFFETKGGLPGKSQPKRVRTPNGKKMAGGGGGRTVGKLALGTQDSGRTKRKVESGQFDWPAKKKEGAGKKN